MGEPHATPPLTKGAKAIFQTLSDTSVCPNLEKLTAGYRGGMTVVVAILKGPTSSASSYFLSKRLHQPPVMHKILHYYQLYMLILLL